MSVRVRQVAGLPRIINCFLGRDDEPLKLADFRSLRTQYDKRPDEEKDRLHEQMFTAYGPTLQHLLLRRMQRKVPRPIPQNDQQTPIYLAPIPIGIDVTLMPIFSPDILTDIKPTSIDPGGAPSNFYRALNILGIKCNALWVIGNGEKARIFTRMLLQEGISLNEKSKFPIDHDTAAHVFFINPGLNLEQRIIQPSPSFTPDQREGYLEMLSEIFGSEPGIFLLSSRPPSGSPPDFQARMLKLAKSKGHFTIVDPKPDQLLNRDYCLPLLNQGMDLFKPDLGEFFILLNQAGIKFDEVERALMEDENGKETVIRYARRLMEQFPNINMLLVSLGINGAVLVIKNSDSWGIASPGGKGKNTVGAGDAALANFVRYLSTFPIDDLFKPTTKGYIFQDALIEFIKAGAAKVQLQGTTMPTLKQTIAVEFPELELIA